MNDIPKPFQDLLSNDKKAYAYLATSMKDASPQVTPVWFNTDGKHILINTAVGRVKDKNMRARPIVALCITDPANPYRYLQIKGRVVESATKGADDHIDALSFKYTGNKKYNRRQDEQRITYKILPEKIDAHG